MNDMIIVGKQSKLITQVHGERLIVPIHPRFNAELSDSLDLAIELMEDFKGDFAFDPEMLARLEKESQKFERIIDVTTRELILSN